MAEPYPQEIEGMAARRFADLEVPEPLRTSMERHRDNLAHLVSSLHSAGVSEEQIESSISVLVESYRLELLRAIHAMMRET